MWLSRAVDSINRVVQPISRAIHSVGLAVLVAMMLLTFADVALRYIFNRPIGGSFDITELMMVVVVSLGFAYCGVVKGHVSVDLLVSRIPERSRAIINTITSLIALGLLVLIAWQCFLYIKVIYLKELTSAVLHIPVFPLVAVVAIGLAVFCLVLLTDFIEFLSKAIGK